MKMISLPSGDQVLSIFDLGEKQTSESGGRGMKATAGAMALDVEGQCPKCNKAMGTATAMNETVYYCEPCRVSLPLPIND